MADSEPRFFFDFVDPLSYLLDLELRAVEEDGGLTVVRLPVELRPPPLPLTDPSDECWGDRWTVALEIAAELGVPLRPPPLVPWTRKAHELCAHAGTHGKGDEVVREVFVAHYERGLDIGRVDVLVEIACAQGLDLTETKAALDVDRYEAAVLAARESARAAGVEAPPVIMVQGVRLEGFHNRATLGTFLRPH